MRRHGAHSETRRSFGKVYEVEEGAYGGARKVRTQSVWHKKMRMLADPGGPQAVQNTAIAQLGRNAIRPGELKGTPPGEFHPLFVSGVWQETATPAGVGLR